MVYHVNDYVAMTSNLHYTLETCLDEMDRCQQMLARVNALDHNSEIPSDILDYINEYIGTEGLLSAGSKVASTIGDILAGLKKALMTIWKILCEIFQILFDSQYRHRKVFLDMQKNLITLASDPEGVKLFEEIPCSVISQADAISSINRNKFLVNVVRLTAECTSHPSIDEMLNEFGEKAKIRMEGGRIVNTAEEELVAQKWGSFAQAGWNLKGFQEVIDAHINCISGIEILKDTKNKIEADKRKLEKEIDEYARNNVEASVIADLQKRVAIKIRLTRIISQTIDILIVRYGAISTIIKAINGEAERIMEERDLIKKRFSTWLKEQSE